MADAINKPRKHIEVLSIRLKSEYPLRGYNEYHFVLSAPMKAGAMDTSSSTPRIRGTDELHAYARVQQWIDTGVWPKWQSDRD